MSTEKLTGLLVRHEGLRLKPYRDTGGFLTIGIGRNLDGKGLSYIEAYALCANDIAEVEAQLTKAFSWFKDLSPTRQDVLIDMTFMGIGKVMQFHGMIAALTAKNYRAAAKEMLDSKWAKQVGNRATELAAMMETDQYIGLP